MSNTSPECVELGCALFTVKAVQQHMIPIIYIHKQHDEKIEDCWSMSVGFRSRTSPSLSTPNINEASSKDVTASLHRNVLSWGVWRGKEEKETVSLRAITHSASSQTADSGSYGGVSNLFRAASVPDVVGRCPKSAFTSITIAVQRTLPSLSTPRDPVCPSTPAQPVMISTPPKLLKTFGGRASSVPTSATIVSNCQPHVCRRNPTVAMPNGFGQAYSPADGLAVRDHGKRKAQLVQSSYTEGDRKRDEIGGSLASLSSQPSYRSCIHLEVPLRSTSSVVFLDKSLFISLVELGEGRRRTGQPTLHRSTLSVRLGVSSGRRSSADNKPAQINEGHGRARAATLGRNKRNGREGGAGHCGGPLSKHRGYKVEQTAPAHGVNGKAEDSDTQRRSTTLGLLSFRGPSPSNTKAGRQKGNADEAASPIRSNFRHRQHTSNIGPVDSRTRSKQARSDETEQHDCSSGPQEVPDKTRRSRPKADSLEGTPKDLSLKEALELFRPDFISRSQGRVRRLEQRARRRRSLQESNPDLVVRGLGEDRGKQKRNCTTPDPLSDNLFKPRERSISGREMQLRSRRIYNKLPEVTKKKEDEKKRAVSQTNRLRADVFKKRLLDQILQR